ncbi:MAG: sigma-70 family RNA polymerase sigma factor [Deltaproteobacteria bacterium]|nr:sigma-70 family RNA polymerase sigma factor [Candidatus Zymogenaceae bacterium]
MSTDTQNMNIAGFFETEKNRLVGYVRRLFGEDADRDSEDIVQDVMLGIFSRSDELEAIENISAYVYRAVRNRVIDALRARKPTVSLHGNNTDDRAPALEDILADNRYNAYDETHRSEIRRRITEAIDDLSEDQQAVIIETEFIGKSFQELSEEWDIPIGTLLARKSRGIVKIREALSDLSPTPERKE